MNKGKVAYLRPRGAGSGRASLPSRPDARLTPVLSGLFSSKQGEAKGDRYAASFAVLIAEVRVSCLSTFDFGAALNHPRNPGMTR
jgi:hypothetical protein